MDKRIRRLQAYLLGLALLFAGSGFLHAADELAGDAPNPFSPAPIHHETVASTWRHGLHHVRTTWDGYFKVVPDELAGFEPTTLDKVKATPVFFIERKIQFDIIYGKPGSFYRPFTTPFTKDLHTNFTGWPYGAELWVKEVRGAVHPLFYIDRLEKELVDKVEALRVYTPLHVWAIVRSSAENLPAIEIKKAEVIPETPLSEASLRHIELGYIESNRRHYDLAAQAFEGALRLQLPVIAEERIYGMLGKAFYEQRLFSGARNALANAILRDERNVNNLVLLARTDLRIDKAKEGLEAAERAVAIDPASAAAHAELGLALALLGDDRAGLKELDAAQQLSHNLLPEANRNRAVVLAREGKLEVARDELKQAIITRPTDVEFKMELGDIYITLNSLDLAKTEFTQARELAPQRPEPYYKTALAAKKQGDAAKTEGKQDAAKKFYEEALESVNGAISKDDQFTPAYGLKAEILRNLGRADEARKILDSRGVKSEEPVAKEQETAKPAGDGAAAKRTAPVIEEPREMEPTPTRVLETQ